MNITNSTFAMPNPSARFLPNIAAPFARWCTQLRNPRTIGRPAIRRAISLSTPTACFRGGCLTGPAHAGAELHRFLAYLMKCCVIGRPYRVFGYKGKQVRDNIHSFDLVETFAAFIDKPRVAEVYNMGGGRFCNCSMLEAISLCEDRKSTRLNSSHTVISYAVFCLK